MGDAVEEPLGGGAQTSGLVRVGTTVRRPRHDRSGFVREVLLHLGAVGFTGAPTYLGVDEHDRDILSYVEGDVPHDNPARLTDAQLLSATALVRSFHDATTTSPLRGTQEVICHGDLGPHNTVFRGDVAVALIDWDRDVGPGRRIVDFAHAVWCFADLTERDVPVADQARRLRLMCDAYPGMSADAVVDELTARFVRARDQHAAAGRPDAARIFDGLIDWTRHHRDPLLAAPGRSPGTLGR